MGIFFWKKTGKEANNTGTTHSYTFRILCFLLHPSFRDLCASKFHFPHQFKLLSLYPVILCGYKHITNNKLFYVCLPWKFSAISYKSFGTVLKWKQYCIRNIVSKCSPLFVLEKGTSDRTSLLPLILLCSVDKPPDISLCFQCCSSYDWSCIVFIFC